MSELAMAPSESRRRPLLPLAAFVCAVCSNYYFTGEWFSRFAHLDANVWTWRQSLASVLLVLALVLATLAFSKRDDYPPVAAAEPPRIARWWWFLPFLVTCLGANALYALQGESSLVRWLWLLSLPALVLPLLPTFDRRDFWPIPLWEYLLVLLIVGVAFILRYIYLTDLPFHADNDVAIMGYFTRELVTTNDHTWVGMSASAHQYSEHQLLAVGMRLFGTGHYGLVILSVLAGTATVGVVHFIGRICFNRWVGLIAATLLAFNHVHIHFSRILFGPITTLFLALACLFALHGIRRSSPASFALAGVATGAGLLGYYSGRVGIVVLGVVLLGYLCGRHGPAFLTRLRYVALSLAGTAAAFGPNVVYAATHLNDYNGRGNAVILWNAGAWQHASATYGGGWDTVLFEQTRRTLLAPFFYPDSGSICHLTEPMLGSLAAFLFVLGLGYSLRRWREVGNLYLLAWLGLTFLCGGILTIDPPFWPHLNVALPAMSLLGAIGAERFARLFVSEGRPLTAFAVPGAVATALLLSGVQNFIVYFDFANRHVSARVLAMREIQDLESYYRVVLVSSNTRWDHAAFQFFCPDTEGSDISPAEFLARPLELAKPTAFFLFRDAPPECKKLLQQRFPYALHEDVKDGWGTYTFTLIRVLPEGYVAPVRRTSLPEASRLFAGWPYLTLLGVFLIGPGVLLYRREETSEADVSA